MAYSLRLTPEARGDKPTHAARVQPSSQASSFSLAGSSWLAVVLTR